MELVVLASSTSQLDHDCARSQPELIRFFRHSALAIAGGLLYVMALPPMGFAFLTLLCFVPLIYVLDKCSLLEGVFFSSLFGIVAYICIPLSLLPWGTFVPLQAVMIAAVFFALLGLLVILIARLRFIGSVWLAFPLAYACVQALGESVISVPILLAVTYPMEWLDGRGLFATIGGHGVDYIACAINALLAGLLVEHKKRLLLVALGLILSLFASLHFISAPSTIQPLSSLSVTTVDNNMSYQRVSQLPYSIAVKESIAQELDDLTAQAIAAQPDLIVWPEGGDGLPTRQIVSRRQAFRDLAEHGDYRLIAGSKSFDDNGNEFNVAEYIVNGEFVAQSKKLQLVPLLEASLNAGEAQLFDIDGHKLGVGICFDIAFPSAVNSAVENGAEALVLVSNDSSFGYSALTYMHLRYAAVRAIEQGREVLFVSNTGPSVVIGDNGRIKSGYVHASGAGLYSHALQLQSGRTFYSQYSFWISLAVLLTVTIFLGGVRRLCQKPS